MFESIFNAENTIHLLYLPASTRTNIDPDWLLVFGILVLRSKSNLAG